jgi:dihydropteroate synthase
MMYRLLETEAGKVQAATAALHWKSLELGAQILRVHDVAEAQQLVELYTHLRTYEII